MVCLRSRGLMLMRSVALEAAKFGTRVRAMGKIIHEVIGVSGFMEFFVRISIKSCEGKRRATPRILRAARAEACAASGGRNAARPDDRSVA